ncbi:cilia- and flagella-associated protein 157 [Spodoptera litura]|uniref:Cilia- and flagella-associated protein 157 n=1 Tax=Spodoptera litura TaxID=69820 RepID=A0A9J7EFY4_SPOLT|nr:cilia- and flagella-associated protein 157 [Spodoptera litura]
MAPKKDKKKKGPDEGFKGAFTEVERALYELQLADCNRKLARLRQSIDEYEIRNEELQKAYDKLDEDRADIIAYLKNTLNVKTEENTELKEKVKGLEELREIETEQFKETVAELKKNFTTMKDQLTSENKLLAGKLNTLEEFRAIRDDLMRKFENQDRAFEEQEMKYKRMLYDAEKKFVIGKDKLKKEMEERLLHLAQEFQDASELRIAASTHRVIRENIALNNQLDSLLMTQAKVAEQNEKFREDERAAQCAREVAEEQRDKAINKSIVQLKVIDQLTTAFQDVKKQKALYDKKQFDNEKLQIRTQKLTKDNESLSLRVRILEQNLHATLGEQNKSVVETAKLLREREKFKKILKEAAFAVEAALKLDHWSKLDPTREIIDRELVLQDILSVINQYRDAARAESMESLISLGNIYDKGDLGFIPKPVTRKSVVGTGLGTTASLESSEEKRSSASGSLTSSSSVGSLKTIPSITLVPPEEEGQPPTPKDSVPSFTVTSLHSSGSDIDDEEGKDLSDMSKMLEISKAEMQKSLMLEMAYSQASKISLSQAKSDGRKMSLSKAKLETLSGVVEDGEGAEDKTDERESFDKATEQGETAADEEKEPVKDTSDAPQTSEDQAQEGETPEDKPPEEKEKTDEEQKAE